MSAFKADDLRWAQEVMSSSANVRSTVASMPSLNSTTAAQMAATTLSSPAKPVFGHFHHENVQSPTPSASVCTQTSSLLLKSACHVSLVMLTASLVMLMASLVMLMAADCHHELVTVIKQNLLESTI